MTGDLKYTFQYNIKIFDVFLVNNSMCQYLKIFVYKRVIKSLAYFSIS